MTGAVELTSAGGGWRGQVVGYGHWGTPVVVFPSEAGRAWDFENNGMVDAVRWLLDAGRVKLYCVDAADAVTWSDRSVPLEERAARHDHYERWVLEQVVPYVHQDSGGVQPILTVGCSLGAYHAANIALRNANVFPRAIAMSGSYDPTAWHAWGDRGHATYFHNPMDYVERLGGEHLEWLRSRVRVLLVCGQGQWEDTTGALESSKRLDGLLSEKGIKHELDLWGHDVPHDWPSWRAQFAHHLPRFC